VNFNYILLEKSDDKGKVVQAEMALQRFGLYPGSELATRLLWI